MRPHSIFTLRLVRLAPQKTPNYKYFYCSVDKKFLATEQVINFNAQRRAIATRQNDAAFIATFNGRCARNFAAAVNRQCPENTRA